jgi:hypothetical protein
MKINKNDLSFNKLPEKKRREILLKEGNFYNPFEIPDGTVLWNAFTFVPITKRDGEVVTPIISDGEQIFRNPLNSKIISKCLFINNKVVSAWEVTKDNEWAVIEPKEDGTYDVGCFKH